MTPDALLIAIVGAAYRNQSATTQAEGVWFGEEADECLILAAAEALGLVSPEVLDSEAARDPDYAHRDHPALVAWARDEVRILRQP